MSKELDEFYKSYSARIIAIDDTPSVEVMDGGKFKLLSIEEYEEMTNKLAGLEAKLAESEKENDTLTAKLEQANEIINNPDTLIFQQQQLIDNLKSRLAITEKALELACETIKQMCGKPLWIGGNIPSPEPKDSKYFKDIAMGMLENE